MEVTIRAGCGFGVYVCLISGNMVYELGREFVEVPPWTGLCHAVLSFTKVARLAQKNGACSEGRDGTTRTEIVGNGHSGRELGAGRRQSDRHDAPLVRVQATVSKKKKGEGGK